MLSYRSRVNLTILGLAATVSVASALSFVLQTVPMGATDIKGGTPKIGEVTPAVINSTTVFSGTVCNETKVVITDLDFSLKKVDTTGSSTTLKVGATSAGTFNAAGVGHYDFPSNGGLTGNNCVSYEISGVVPDSSGANVVFEVTPSSSQSISGSVVHCNVIPEYEFDEMADQKRDGIAQMFHARAIAVITNVDDDALIESFSGDASALDVSRTLVAVHAKDDQGNALPNANVTINGSDFTVDGFTPIGEDKTVLLIFEFSSALNGTRMRAQIQAHYQL